ncbi:MAG: hypothetical protein KatS3mg129_1755 [Leptospiraceae bacterium]|nr:MAG: hypothetical protein KatS3mg129_1755 [Leptospiraceae bacterium]
MKGTLKLFLFFLFTFSLIGNHKRFFTFQNDKLDIIQTLKEYGIRHSDFLIDSKISLKPQEFTYHQLLFYLNCEVEDASFLKDEVGKLNIVKKYLFLIKEESNRNYVCYFKNRNNVILVETNPEEWPYKKNTTFSLSFWFKPFIPLKDQNLMEWSSFTESKIKKFRIGLNKHSIEVNFTSILKKQNRYIDLNLFLENSNVLFNQWNHFFITFDLKNKNIIQIYLNGNLIKLVQLPANTKWDFQSLHWAPIQIGGKFLGFIDDFMILNNYYDKPITYKNYPELDIVINSGRVNQSIKEFYIPPVLLDNRIKTLKILLDYNKPEGSILKIQYRFLDHLNYKNNSWYDLPIEQKKVSFPHSELKKFIQFRIKMLQDSEGKNTPLLTQFILEKERINNLPEVHHLRIIKELSNKEQICIEWQKVPEEIIEEKGGYNLHIGIKEQELELTIRELYSDGRWYKINKKNTDFPMTEKEKELEKIRPNYWKQYKNNHIRIIITKDLLYHIAEKQLLNNHLSINRIKLIFEEDFVYYIKSFCLFI